MKNKKKEIADIIKDCNDPRKLELILHFVKKFTGK